MARRGPALRAPGAGATLTSVIHSTAFARSFEYVPFGQRARDGALACDGLVEGDTVHLSHWGGNHTADEYRADTSVEIALRYAEKHGGGNAHDAQVTNNHFDTDGVLAVWVLLAPEAALARRGLIVSAAEAGDFEEWPADERGLWVDAALRTLARGAGGEANAYARVLSELPALLDGIEAREELWGSEWRALLAARERARAGALAVEQVGRIAVLRHRAGEAELPGAVLSQMAPPGCTRWLLAFERADGAGFEYRYERPRWAWATTVVRPTIAAPSRNAVARGLGEGWALKGDLGMTGLLRTTRAIAPPPREVAERLVAGDSGAG